MIGSYGTRIIHPPTFSIRGASIQSKRQKSGPCKQANLVSGQHVGSDQHVDSERT